MCPVRSLMCKVRYAMCVAPSPLGASVRREKKGLIIGDMARQQALKNGKAPCGPHVAAKYPTCGEAARFDLT
jgi:hypothetical protein